MLSKLCPTPYYRDAQCPRFRRAINEILGADAGVNQFVQRHLGYAITGNVKEQVLTVWYGAGSNGKTTAVNAILETIGDDYTGMVPVELLMQPKGEQHPTIVACLHGKHLMVAAESTKADASTNHA